MRGWITKAAATALLLVVASGRAEALKAEIVEYGVMLSERGKAKPDHGGKTLSPVHEMSDVRFIQRTDQIEAGLCKTFGIAVEYSDGPMPEQVEVRVVHPRFTRPDGESSELEMFYSDVVASRTQIGFTFDYEWEAQPGEWAMVIVLDGVELTRKTFTVTRPLGGLRSECGVVS